MDPTHALLKLRVSSVLPKHVQTIKVDLALAMRDIIDALTEKQIAAIITTPARTPPVENVTPAVVQARDNAA